jgi:hypothetical protein
MNVAPGFAFCGHWLWSGWLAMGVRSGSVSNCTGGKIACGLSGFEASKANLLLFISIYKISIVFISK